MSGRIDYERLASDIQAWIKNVVHQASVEGVVVGISGGLDSAVTAALAAGALSPARVLGLLMPCESNPRDTDDGLRIAAHLGIGTKVIDLTPVLGRFLEAGDLEGIGRLGVANIKSRLRMVMLYAHSGNRLVVGTGNYSEILVGYWTKWGDGAADFLPLAGLFKEEVRELAGVLGLPGWVVEKPPSAGLWEGQSDEDEMGVTYSQIRDFFLGKDVPDGVAAGIRKMIDTTEHKRKPIPRFDMEEWMERHGFTRT